VSATQRIAALGVAALAGLAGIAVSASSGPAAKTPLRVGMVNLPSAGGLLPDDAIVGLRRAVRELGIRATVLTPTVKEGFAPSLTSLARQGDDLVFGVIGNEAYDMSRVAPKFPHTRFVLLDTSTRELERRPQNLLGVVFEEQQIGYLMGYLAALMEDRVPGRHVVSTVGGIKFPPVDRFIAGFQAGARKADPRITLLNGYSNDFADPARCKRVASGQIARGSGVVFQVAGSCGLGALAAAREHHVWGIGVDDDQSALGPYILTSAVKRFDVAVFETIRALQNKTLPLNGDTFLTLEHGALALGKVSPRVPRSYVARVEKIRRDIIAGRIRNIPTTPLTG
jgi:basic membrane protein A and related proteins